ncbi:Fc.00g019860.m01.CDS01 [Cosmosporella sp. VM-42]
MAEKMSMFRHLMSAKVRSNAGCWTCRLRRKKCDETRPICDACRTLEITCYFDDDKPEWMDAGPRQKEMAEKIKSQVKKQASQRRDRKYMEMLEAGTRTVSIGEGTPDHVDGHVSGASDTSPASGHELSTPASSNTSGASPPEIPWHSQFLVQPEDPTSATGTSVEVHFIMIYLDYVFPYFFPYYRPPILAGGRGWMLDVLQSNKSVWHTAISLSSYFFSIVLANGEKEHEECTNRMVHQLQGQLQQGLRELQKEMCAINLPGHRASAKERLLVMQSILQMLIFEVATSNKENWRMHLDAALAMFLQILPKPELWTETLHNLYSLKWPPPSIGIRRPFSTNQAALRFFTANIFYVDVMSSITLERTPRLHHYQADIIPGCSTSGKGNAQSSGPLFMEEFLGLQNWVIQILGDIAALDAWKKDQKKKGSLSMHELVQRGQVISEAIKGGLQMMEQEAQSRPHQTKNSFYTMPLDPMPSLQLGRSEEHPALLVHNIIWLQAALTYIYVVISGWQPSSSEICYSVSRITEMLTQLPQDTCLRSLCWPFCIAGCLSPQEDEDKYRAMMERMGPLQVFGTIKDAMEVMEKVWSRRDTIDESWDVAKCLRILGHGVLLI